MKKILYILLAATGLSACDYLEVEPTGQVIPSTTTAYRALLAEGYSQFPYRNSKGCTGMLSDEVESFNEDMFYGSEGVTMGYNFIWEYTSQMYELPYSEYYRAIFQSNAVIAGLMSAQQDSSESKEQILGEAYALRAYSHFDLVNLYAAPYNAATAATDRGVPLSTLIDIEQKYKPASVAAVYQQILDDIEAAEGLMDVTRQTNNTLNYRFSLDALKAFKARVMLYMSNWEEAYTAATALLGSYELFDMNTADATVPLPWSGKSTETILALERPFAGSNGDITPASEISSKIRATMGPDDNRENYLKEATKYNEFYEVVPLGYDIVNRSTSDRVSIRIAEMYLIAAEAAAHIDGKLSDAKTHLLALQEKRLKPAAMATKRTAVQAMDATALLSEIADERARELLGEGHRWFDLRRTTQPEIVRVHNGSTVTLRQGDSRYRLPFPQSAILANPSLND